MNKNEWRNINWTMPIKWIDLRDRLNETGLFRYEEHNSFFLLNTDFSIRLFSDTIIRWYWCGVVISFEEVLDNVPEEIQVKLLFHLDLFR